MEQLISLEFVLKEKCGEDTVLPFPDFTKMTGIFCTICLEYLCQASC